MPVVTAWKKTKEKTAWKSELTKKNHNKGKRGRPSYPPKTCKKTLKFLLSCVGGVTRRDVRDSIRSEEDALAWLVRYGYVSERSQEGVRAHTFRINASGKKFLKGL